MKFYLCIGVILSSLSPAWSYSLGQNPALCFGLIASQSTLEKQALAEKEPDIRALFAKIGPKDSTDGRGFEDWANIGRAIANDRDDKNRIKLIKSCRNFFSTQKAY